MIVLYHVESVQMFKLGWEVCKAMVGTPHKVLRYLSSKGGTPHNIEIQGRLTAGWLAGSVSDYSTTLWLHLASGNLPDSQLS